MRGEFVSIIGKVPVDQLRRDWPPEVVQRWVASLGAPIVVLLLEAIQRGRLSITQADAVFRWIVVECEYPLGPVGHHSRPTTTISWVASGHYGHQLSAQWLDVLLTCKQAVPFTDKLCAVFDGDIGIHLQGRIDSARRLIDAGVGHDHSRCDFVICHREMLQRWIASRMACRRACWAVLALRRRLPVMTRCVPKEVAEIMARQLWCKRWCYDLWLRREEVKVCL